MWRIVRLRGFVNDPVLKVVGDLVSEIEDQLGEGPSYVSRAVIVCEQIDADGDRFLRIIRDRNLKNWEVRGMLTEVLSDMDACDVVDVLEGDE